MRAGWHPKQRVAFSLVELLVTLAIIALLAGLLLPAIQAARSTARMSACASNLRQLCQALLLHHDTYSRFPTGGWGEAWVGLAGRGSGDRQPGGWLYCSLPFLGEEVLHGIESRQPSTGERAQLVANRLATPIGSVVCPDRRRVDAWPTRGVEPDAYGVLRPHLRQPRSSAPVDAVARSDYAMNAGTIAVTSVLGPSSEGAAASGAYSWPKLGAVDGIAHIRQQVRLAQVTDGASKTYLVAEKFLAATQYTTGWALGDNESMYAGFSSDLYRFTRVDLTPSRDAIENPPVGDWRFGSSHAAGFNAGFCDGSVRGIDYSVSPLTHRNNGSRADIESLLPTISL